MGLELLAVGEDYVLTTLLIAVISARLINFYLSSTASGLTPTSAALSHEIAQLKKEIASLTSESQFTQKSLAQRKLLRLEKMQAAGGKPAQTPLAGMPGMPSLPSIPSAQTLITKNAGLVFLFLTLFVVGFRTPVTAFPSIICFLARFHNVLQPSCDAYPHRSLSAFAFVVACWFTCSTFLAALSSALKTPTGVKISAAALARGSPVRGALIAVMPSLVPESVLRDEAAARGVDVDQLKGEDFRTKVKAA